MSNYLKNINGVSVDCLAILQRPGRQYQELNIRELSIKDILVELGDKAYQASKLRPGNQILPSALFATLKLEQ
ncbi:MAG: hypothetical protein AAGD25_24125 [Cyanobacteria bacterium P01_F01_bin.150]